nr:MAG TPA: hypothetical protein [Caudoviricetes sp.]
MDFTKKVNEFGLFGNVLVVNNDVMESVNVVKTDEDEKVLMAAAHITSEAIRNQVNDGKLSAFEGLITGINATDSTTITLVTPDLKDIKIFTEAVIKTAEDGNMCHMKDYVHETGNNIPQEIWDYIYKLTNDK